VLEQHPAQTEVDVHDVTALEAVEQVLAVRLGHGQRAAVEVGGLGAEAALRRRHRDRPTQHGAVVACVAVQQVALGHGASLPRDGSFERAPPWRWLVADDRTSAVQTFLPHPGFAASAAVLDDRRLGKQRVEVLQILRALTFADYGWRNHPAVTMWRGHVPALVAYGDAVVDAWSARGRADRTRAQIREFAAPEPPRDQAALQEAGLLPAWLGWEALHRSHRSALLRKAPEHYGRLFSDVPDDLPYVWPDPPPPEVDDAPRSAWVVRPADPTEAHGLRDAGLVTVPVPPAGARRGTKAQRQIRRFVDDLRPGDAVATLAGDGLLVGRVGGAAFELGEGHLARAVTWLAEVPRAALRRPAQLQDPQRLFVLRGEPAVERVWCGGPCG
jgi:hypothetical protein